MIVRCFVRIRDHWDSGRLHQSLLVFFHKCSADKILQKQIMLCACLWIFPHIIFYECVLFATHTGSSLGYSLVWHFPRMEIPLIFLGHVLLLETTFHFLKDKNQQIFCISLTRFTGFYLWLLLCKGLWMFWLGSSEVTSDAGYSQGCPIKVFDKAKAWGAEWTNASVKPVAVWRLWKCLACVFI